jgi:hypothetical protein
VGDVFVKQTLGVSQAVKTDQVFISITKTVIKKSFKKKIQISILSFTVYNGEKKFAAGNIFCKSRQKIKGNYRNPDLLRAQ